MDDLEPPFGHVDIFQTSPIHPTCRRCFGAKYYDK